MFKQSPTHQLHFQRSQKQLLFQTYALEKLKFYIHLFILH